MRMTRHGRAGIDLDVNEHSDIPWHGTVSLLQDLALDPGCCRSRCLGRDGRSGKGTDGTQGTADEQTTLQHVSSSPKFFLEMTQFASEQAGIAARSTGRCQYRAVPL